MSERISEINTYLDKLLAEYPLIPRSVIHGMITAETSYNKKEYYRHEPAYWHTYMHSNKKFWAMAYRHITGEIPADETAISKLFSASYGIMQTMYDIALDIDMRYNKEIGFQGVKFANVQAMMNKVVAGESDISILDTFVWPEEINDDDELGLWFGLEEMRGKMNRTWAALVDVFDDVDKQPVNLTDFLIKGVAPRVCGKPVEILDFFKMCVSAYQCGSSTVAKLLRITRGNWEKMSWDNIRSHVIQIRNPRTTEMIKKHIDRAFKGITNDAIITDIKEQNK